ESVQTLCRGFARWGLTRADVVVAVGGGVVTDVAGLAAAVYHRGVAVIHVPHVFAGQVDAAIGGKTGVNLPEGKNLVGAFWQPAAVICDVENPWRPWTGCGTWPWRTRWRLVWPARRPWWAATSARGASGPCSTTATRWPTPWRRPGLTTSATARRWASGW